MGTSICLRHLGCQAATVFFIGFYGCASAQDADSELARSQETARQQEVAKVANLAKMKENPVPTLDDIQAMLVKASMEMTNSERLYTQQLTKRSYKAISMSSYRTEAEVTITAENLVCRRQGKFHQCSYSEIFRWTSFQYRGDAGSLRPIKETKQSGLFKWSEHGGLTAAKGTNAVLVSNIGQGTNQSSGSARNPDVAARDADNMREWSNERQREREEANDARQRAYEADQEWRRAASRGRCKMGDICN